MKVKELIEELRKADPENEVYFGTDKWQWWRKKITKIYQEYTKGITLIK